MESSLRSLKPSSLAGLLAALALPLLPTPRAAAQSSTYLAYSDGADYSGMTASGGTIIVPYELAFGTPPPSLGSSFNVLITVSAITSYNPGAAYSWTTTPPDPSLGVVGLSYPANIFSNLPAQNQTALPVNNGSVTLDPGVNSRLWMESNMTAGAIDYLGEFTVTISALPVTPGYHAPTQLNVWSEFSSFLVDEDSVLAGFWATMGPPLVDATIESSTRITPFDQSVTYRCTAFSDGFTLPVDSFATMWNYGGAVQFEPIPEPTTIALLALIGAGSCLRRLRKEG